MRGECSRVVCYDQAKILFRSGIQKLEKSQFIEYRNIDSWPYLLLFFLEVFYDSPGPYRSPQHRARKPSGPNRDMQNVHSYRFGIAAHFAYRDLNSLNFTIPTVVVGVTQECCQPRRRKLVPTQSQLIPLNSSIASIFRSSDSRVWRKIIVETHQTVPRVMLRNTAVLCTYFKESIVAVEPR